MRYRKLDANGDYSFGNQQNDFFIDSPEAVAQAVQTSLKLWLGEWFLDLTAGVPYPEGVLGKHPKEMADQTIISAINQVQGVVNITNFQSVIDPVTRQYSSISGTLNTIYGATQLQMQNYGNF
jgi:hypothetical protein